MTAATLTTTISAAEESCEFPHVLDGVALSGAAAHLAKVLDRGLLDEAGWDPRRGCCTCPRSTGCWAGRCAG